MRRPIGLNCRRQDQAGPGGMTKIAISYRRKDDPSAVHWMHKQLSDRYGSGNVFIDIDDIPPGKDFRTELEAILKQIEVLIVVIGPDWLERSETGLARIKETEDFVRFEIRIALQRNIIILPLLINGGVMPHRDDLPEDIQSFTYRNAASLQTRTMIADVKRLESGINQLLKERFAEKRKKIVRTIQSKIPFLEWQKIRSQMPTFDWQRIRLQLSFFVMRGAIATTAILVALLAFIRPTDNDITARTEAQKFAAETAKRAAEDQKRKQDQEAQRRQQLQQIQDMMRDRRIVR